MSDPRETALSDDDNRVAVELLPREDQGYTLRYTNSGRIREYELTYDEGGHVLTLLRTAIEQFGSDRGVE